MAIGITRSELTALIIVVGVVTGGLTVKSCGARSAKADRGVWIEPGKDWEPVTPEPIVADAEKAKTPRAAQTPNESPTPDPTAATPASVGIDINTATLKELDRLPGIGEQKAKAILEHRKRIGRFKSVDELNDVPGIGEKRLERIRPYLKPFAPAADKPTSPTLLIVHATQTGTPGNKLPINKVPISKLNEPNVSPADTQTKINVNQADAEELDKLPGIGPAMAKRIIDARTQQPFRTPEDLLRVKGIGEKNLEKLKPMIRFR